MNTAEVPIELVWVEYEVGSVSLGTTTKKQPLKYSSSNPNALVVDQNKALDMFFKLTSKEGAPLNLSDRTLRVNGWFEYVLRLHTKYDAFDEATKLFTRGYNSRNNTPEKLIKRPPATPWTWINHESYRGSCLHAHFAHFETSPPPPKAEHFAVFDI